MSLLLIGLCPLCQAPGVDHPAEGACVAGASCSNIDCILHIAYQDDTNRHVRREQWPKACVFESRMLDGSMTGTGRAWCQTHGFDCPKFAQPVEPFNYR